MTAAGLRSSSGTPPLPCSTREAATEQLGPDEGPVEGEVQEQPDGQAEPSPTHLAASPGLWGATGVFDALADEALAADEQPLEHVTPLTGAPF